MSLIKNVSQLASSPMEAMQDVKKSGWVTPILCVGASLGYLHYGMAWPTPARELAVLKWWAIMQVAATLSIWLAGWPQGGRGTLADTAKVLGFLTLVDGLALFVSRTFLMVQFIFLIALLLPVLLYLAVKAVHEYDKDGIAFQVTASAFFLFMVLMAGALNFLSVQTLQSLISAVSF